VAEQRTVLTLNRRHFIRLHQTTPEHAGIVVCTYDPDFVALAQRIHAALEAQRIERPSSLCPSLAHRCWRSTRMQIRFATSYRLSRHSPWTGSNFKCIRRCCSRVFPQ
jgi:hypothetical protein